MGKNRWTISWACRKAKLCYGMVCIVGKKILGMDLISGLLVSVLAFMFG